MGRKPRNQHVYGLTGKFTVALGIKLRNKWHQRNARAYSINPCDEGFAGDSGNQKDCPSLCISMYAMSPMLTLCRGSCLPNLFC